MPPLLKWSEAEKGHRHSLQHFVCAVPEKPIKDAGSGWTPYHPRFWEFDAQCIIRRLRIAPPREVTILVGEDDQGVAAVSSFSELDGPDVVHIDVMGLAPRHRRQGGAHAREMMTTTLALIESRAIEAGALELIVEGEIYKENAASLRLARSVGMEFVEEAETGAQTWALRLPLATLDQN